MYVTGWNHAARGAEARAPVERRPMLDLLTRLGAARGVVVKRRLQAAKPTAANENLPEEVGGCRDDVAQMEYTA